MVLQFLTSAERQEVVAYLQEVKLEKGQYLFQPGDMADGVFFIKNGRMCVQAKTGFADKQQVIALLDPFAPVGESGLTGTEFRGMTILAIEDGTVLYHLSRDDFQKLENSKPLIAIKILKRLLVIASLRLRRSSERLAHVL